MTLAAPTIAGVSAPRPSSWERTPEPVESVVELADGSVSRYVQGYRMTFALSWDILTVEQGSALEAAALVTTPIQYIDLDGVSYVVQVRGYDALAAIPGTDPVRYTFGVTLQEPTTRTSVPPLATAPSTAPGTGDGGADVEVDPTDPDVLLVSGGAIDPTDPDVLIWTGS